MKYIYYITLIAWMPILVGMHDKRPIYTITLTYESGEKKSFQSPCGWIKASSLDTRKVTIPVERTFVTINPADGEVAFLTPVSPCVAVIARHTLTSLISIVHVFYPNKIAAIPPLIKRELFEKQQQSYNPSTLAITLLSKKIPDSLYQKKWLSEHRGKTQEEQMEYIRSTLIADLQIEESAIESLLLDTELDSCATQTIVLNGDLHPNGKICLYHTHPFKEYFIPSPKHMYTYLYTLTEERYGLRTSPYHEKHIYTYDSTEFTESPKNNCTTIAAMKIPRRGYNKNVLNNPFSYLNVKVRIKNIVQPWCTYINCYATGITLLYLFCYLRATRYGAALH